MRHLPPLNALRAFEATSRHLSITNAAYELSVNQSSISKHIRNLENHYGVELFKRVKNGVILTAHGDILASKTIKAFDDIESASIAINNTKKSKIFMKVNMPPTIAIYCITPYLSEFCRENPNITLEVLIGDGKVNFSENQCEFAFRVMDKDLEWKNPHITREMLFEEEQVAICSPQDLEYMQKVGVREFLSSHQLIRHTSGKDVWQQVLAEHNLSIPDRARHIGLEHVYMIISAVENNVGLGIVPKFLVKDKLNTGTISQFLSENIVTNRAYYIFYPKPKQYSDSVKKFKSWFIKKLFSFNL
jgi:LysR family glycine cleavage system transcriptional activator